MFSDQHLSLIENLKRSTLFRMNFNRSASVVDKRTFQFKMDLAADNISTSAHRRLQNAVRISE
jgi:hypothetical protein